MAAQLADEAGRVPGGAAAQLPLLQQHDVRPAEPGQVIGHRTADNTAADDDDLCLRWKILSHETASRSHGRPYHTKG
ncbi:hypothetical protein D3C86_2049140 [compost metagenome]